MNKDKLTLYGLQNLEYTSVSITGKSTFTEIGVFIQSGLYLSSFHIILKHFHHSFIIYYNIIR